MKKILLPLFLGATFLINAQNVGIGTNTPLARLHIADSSVVFSASGQASVTPGNPPISGVGRRMMWYTDKAAFRVGYVNTTNWDKSNIGKYSSAFGNNNMASGDASFAAGNTNIASGDASIALGDQSNASGAGSTALGAYTNASGTYSIAMGSNTIASGSMSTAMGEYTIASERFSTAMGTGTHASGYASTAIGHAGRANADYTIAMGESVIANSWVSTSLGRHNDPILTSSSTEWKLTEPLLIVGNGTGPTDKKNALVILKNGNAGIGTNKPIARLHVIDSNVVFSASGLNPSIPGNPPISGGGRRMMWYADKAAFRAGYVNTTNWDSSNTGDYSTVLGNNNMASGYSSFTAGNTNIASGENSIALGFLSKAASHFSVAIGESVTTNSWSSTTLGRYNDPILTLPSTDLVLTEPLLIVGNGTSESDKKNALVILKNGNTGIGNNNPNTPLSFPNIPGRKISLYESTLNSQYGFAVESAQLRIYSDAPGAKISFGYYNSGSYTERMWLDNASGDLHISGSYYFSDARYKKQITRLQNPLEKIMAINGVEYFLRTDDFPSKHFDNKLQVGLIAQEVEKVLPQVVQTDKDGYKAIDYAKVVPLLVEGIKEQQKQIDELKKVNERLILQFEELRKMIKN